MNIRSKWLAASLLGAALTFSVAAQDAPAGHKGHKRIAEMQERLKLTPDQSAKIQPILQEQRTKMQALRAEAKSGDKAELRAKMQAIHQETSAQLKSILSEEQMAEWTKLQSERRGKMRNRG